MYFFLSNYPPQGSIALNFLADVDEAADVSIGEVPATAFFPKLSRLRTPHRLFWCTSEHPDASSNFKSKTKNWTSHFKYKQGWLRSELSHKGDKRRGSLGWCGACVGIPSVAAMSRDFFFFYRAEENVRGSVYLKRSQLQPICHAEIRRRKRRLSYNRLSLWQDLGEAARDGRQAGRQAGGSIGWLAGWMDEAGEGF